MRQDSFTFLKLINKNSTSYTHRKHQEFILEFYSFEGSRKNLEQEKDEKLQTSMTVLNTVI